MFGHSISHKFFDVSVTVEVSNVVVSQYVLWYLSVWVTRQSVYVTLFVSQSVSHCVKRVGQVCQWQCFSLSFIHSILCVWGCVSFGSCISFCFGRTASLFIVLGRFRFQGLFGGSSPDKDLMQANLRIWADSAGCTG